jgi:predicted acetyltransferase
MAVRPLTADDRDAVAGFVLMAAFSPDRPLPDDALSLPEARRWLDGWGDETGVAWVVGDEMLGAAWARRMPGADERAAEVIVAVRPEARGQGIGRQLLVALLDRARRAGLAGLALTVSPRNLAAMKLYGSVGFRQCGSEDGGPVLMVWHVPDPRAPELRLRPLQLQDEAEALAAHRELAAESFEFLLDWRPGERWAGYLERLERLRRGDDVPADRVPATFLAAVCNGVLVGRVSIRHELNALLADVGGHIGYGVRPAHRGRGFGHDILRQALLIARAEGVSRALVTCADDNIASIRIIEGAGGELEDVRTGADGTKMRRYWIGRPASRSSPTTA